MTWARFLGFKSQHGAVTVHWRSIIIPDLKSAHLVLATGDPSPGSLVSGCCCSISKPLHYSSYTCWVCKYVFQQAKKMCFYGVCKKVILLSVQTDECRCVLCVLGPVVWWMQISSRRRQEYSVFSSSGSHDLLDMKGMSQIKQILQLIA